VSGALVPVADVEKMAVAVARSGLFGVKTPDQALALMLVAQAEGLHPAIAARDYHVINGRPTLKADAMMARFLAAGGRVKWLEIGDAKVEAEFSHPAGGTVIIDWTAERAKRAGITNEMHRKYPRQMLRARVISEGIRTVFPGCVVGTYTPEEAGDMEPREPVRMRDMGPVDEIAPPAPPAPAVTLDAVLEQIAMTATLEGLELVRPMMRSLPADDRKEAIAAAQARANQIRAESEPPPVPTPSAAEAGDGAL
jgi:hypothetical protein